MSKIAELNETVEIKIDGNAYSFPVITGTENEKGIDIGKLRDQTGYVTLDIGYKNTGATKSAITYLDGENGILHYRGYSIDQLAENASFTEVAYLLIFGELPTSAQLDEFENNIRANLEVPENIKQMLNSFPQGAHPMGMLATSICSLSAFYPQSLDPHRPWELKMLTIYRLMAKLPTIAAWIHRKNNGFSYLSPRAGTNYCENFLGMMFGKDGENYEADPAIVSAINTLLILHADHEQNCSTSTVRIVGSSQANLYAATAAGITALWGPLHGGANQEVIEMLEKIKADGGDTAKWVEKAKSKDDNFRLMGFGHRVYKNFDPRAKIIKKACDQVLAKLGINDPVLDIAKRLEEAALSDPYFIERKLYPNVDFYSGIIYRALGIPAPMFTVMFALGRLPGWTSQWKEMIESGEPIGRPRQIYTGHPQRPFVPMSERK
jgi:citrate synthase